MSNEKETEKKHLEAILEDEKVQKALLETGKPSQKIPGQRKKIFLLVGYTILIVFGAGLLNFMLEEGYLPISERYFPLVKKLILGTVLVTAVFFLNSLFRKIVRRKVSDRASAYNFRSLINFISFALIVVVVISLIFSNWYATLVSFGVVSIILGLALQNPLTSLFGWVYLLLRKPYEVGDRIKIGSVYGDVMNVGYFDTTLWEFKGDYLSRDHPSGRIIKYANSRIFNEYVVNYSWPLFPFIWNEVKFYVSYDSDFDFISRVVTEIAENEIGEAMMRRVKRLKKILADSMIQELEIKEKPSVIFNAHINTWIEVTVRFLVQPKNSGPTKSLLFTHIMKELKQHPEKVIFPNTKK